jgi:carbonic anhydrase
MSAIRKLIDGHHIFQETDYTKMKDSFEELAKGQAPEVLLITCSDSRINPELILQYAPGDVFMIRNAGNIVPISGDMSPAEMGTIEFAVSVLNVKHIIVCGHSDCGAVKGMLDPKKLETLPYLHEWILRSSTDFRIDESASLEAHIQQNIENQLTHLQQYAFIDQRVQDNELSLHGWMYDISGGTIQAFSESEKQWVQL